MQGITSTKIWILKQNVCVHCYHTCGVRESKYQKERRHDQHCVQFYCFENRQMITIRFPERLEQIQYFIVVQLIILKSVPLHFWSNTFQFFPGPNNQVYYLPYASILKCAVCPSVHMYCDRKLWIISHDCNEIISRTFLGLVLMQKHIEIENSVRFNNNSCFKSHLAKYSPSEFYKGIMFCDHCSYAGGPGFFYEAQNGT